MTAAGEAHARGDWRATYDALAPQRDVLDPTDLARLADAAWWLGETPDSMALSEDLFQRLVGAGSDTEAADRALRLSLQWFARGDLQIAFAWMARARRLLDTVPRCHLHGYLAYLEASVDLEVTEDPEPAAAAAAHVRACALDFSDPALDSFALALGGMAEVRRGRTAAGFAQLDEAMLPVLAGRVDPLWSGDLYCTVIHLCDALADLARMRSWTEALARWSNARSTTFVFAGVTRIHELQLVAAEGGWDTVERELGDASADLVGAHGWLAGEGYYGLGEVRRLRGDPAGAQAAYRRAEELGRDPQPGRALLAAREGRPGEALAQLRVSLAEQSPLGRAGLLLAAVDLALETGDPSYAETLAGELEETAARFGTAGLRARAAEAARRACGCRATTRRRPCRSWRRRLRSTATNVTATRRPRCTNVSPQRTARSATRPGRRPRRRPRWRSTRASARPRISRRLDRRPRPGGLIRARGRGAAAGRHRLLEPAGRRLTDHQRQDGQPPPREHLHQDRRLHPHRGGRLGSRARSLTPASSAPCRARQYGASGRRCVRRSRSYVRRVRPQRPASTRRSHDHRHRTDPHQRSRRPRGRRRTDRRHLQRRRRSASSPASGTSSGCSRRSPSCRRPRASRSPTPPGSTSGTSASGSAAMTAGRVRRLRRPRPHLRAAAANTPPFLTRRPGRTTSRGRCSYVALLGGVERRRWSSAFRARRRRAVRATTRRSTT